MDMKEKIKKRIPQQNENILERKNYKPWISSKLSYLPRKILRTRYRLWGDRGETINHIIN